MSASSSAANRRLLAREVGGLRSACRRSMCTQSAPVGAASPRSMPGVRSVSAQPARAAVCQAPPAAATGEPDPTVTDADLVLGRIPPGTAFSGMGALDRDAAVAALAGAGIDPAGVVDVVKARWNRRCGRCRSRRRGRPCVTGARGLRRRRPAARLRPGGRGGHPRRDRSRRSGGALRGRAVDLAAAPRARAVLADAFGPPRCAGQRSSSSPRRRQSCSGPAPTPRSPRPRRSTAATEDRATSCASRACGGLPRCPSPAQRLHTDGVPVEVVALRARRSAEAGAPASIEQVLASQARPPEPVQGPPGRGEGRLHPVGARGLGRCGGSLGRRCC